MSGIQELLTTLVVAAGFVQAVGLFVRIAR